MKRWMHLPAFYSGEENKCDINMSINKAPQQSGFSIYPNPGNGTFTLSGNKSFVAAEVFNSVGQIVIINSSEIKNNTVDLSQLSNGIYFLRLTDAAKQSGVFKLILQK